MLEIFFNHRAIYLTDNPNITDNGTFVKFNDIKSLKKEIENFLNNLSIINLYIYHDELQVLFQSFKLCFDYVEAAGGLVRNPIGELLVIFRYNKWDLPKGKIDPGESPEKAAIREVEEECGIHSPVIVNNLRETFHTFYTKKKNILKKTYWFEMIYDGKEKPKPQLEENITLVKWIKPTEIEFIMKNTFENLKPIFEFGRAM